MRGSTLSRLVALAVAVAGLTGCDNTVNDSGFIVNNPTPVYVTETFTGSLAKNGAVTHPFVVNTGGTVVATLKEITPDNTIALGIALGTWNGTSCQIVQPDDDALLGASVTGTVTSTGVLCVRIYDAAGKLTDTSSYSIDVNHP
jgi:hypothetical protein